MVMVRIYGWVEKSVEARSASGKSVVELDRCVFFFFLIFIMTSSRLFLSFFWKVKSGQGEENLWEQDFRW